VHESSSVRKFTRLSIKKGIERSQFGISAT
jgi:hypothetical protein